MSVPAGVDVVSMAHKPSTVRVADRVWDAVALVFVVAGIALFAVARRALGAMAAGLIKLPKGASYVAQTDWHVAQIRMAVWLMATGLLIGVVAAARHKLRGR